MSDPPALRTVTARLFGGPYHGQTFGLPGDYLEHWTPDGNHLYARGTVVSAQRHVCVTGIATTHFWRVYTHSTFPRDDTRAQMIFPILVAVEPEARDWTVTHPLLAPIADEVAAGRWCLPPGVIQLDTIDDRAWRYSVAREFEEMLEAMQADDDPTE